MTVNLFLKAGIIWVIIALFAIMNGIFRENVLVSILGQLMAVSVSGIMLSIIVFIVTYVFFPLIEKHHTLAYFFIGVQWVLMTLIFEFVFGHYVMGKPWSSIFQVFNIIEGNLFIIVLVVSLFSPILAEKLKGK